VIQAKQSLSKMQLASLFPKHNLAQTVKTASEIAEEFHSIVSATEETREFKELPEQKQTSTHSDIFSKVEIRSDELSLNQRDLMSLYLTQQP
jgi:hypothetical protein